jgi:arylsulfatase A-like enzyme
MSTEPGRRAGDFIVMGVWVGMVFGVAEAAVLLLFYHFGSDSMWRNGVGFRSLWSNAAVEAVFFGCVAAGLAMAARLVKPLRERWGWPLGAAALAGLAMFGVLASPRSLELYGCVAAGLGAAVLAFRTARAGRMAPEFFRRTLRVVVAGVALAGMGAEGGMWWRERSALESLPAARPGAPNVLILIADALRADHVSSYGYSRETTPNVDKLAREGMLFERAFSGGHWTMPGHVALFTGALERRGWFPPVKDAPPYPPLLAETLSQHGYAAMIAAANTMWVTPRVHFARGTAQFNGYYHSLADLAGRSYFPKMAQNAVRLAGWFDTPNRMRAEQVNDYALEWVERSRELRRPFFIALNYMDVHDPYWPPEPFTHKYNAALTRRGLLKLHSGTHPPPNTPEAGRRMVVDAYDSCLAYLDARIGELLEELERRGVLDRTIVIFTSDHGEALGEERRYGHTSPFLTQEVTRIPLIIRYPPGVARGERVKRNVSHAQIPATVLQLLGLEAAATQWVSLLAPPAEADSPVLINGDVRQAVVSGKWHYIVEHDTQKVRLYNLDADPAQADNLAGKPEQAEIEAALRQKLESLMAAHHVRARARSSEAPIH